MAKVIFLHLSVILFRGGVGCLPQCMLGYHTPQEQTSWSRPLGADTPRSRHPPGADTSQEQTPLGADAPLGADTPRSRHPPEQTPLQSRHTLEQTPPSRHPPGADTPWEADSGIRSTSGQYASYWNAFLFFEFFACSLLVFAFAAAFTWCE